MNGPNSLLIISYHFPPDGAVGGLRWAALGKYLAARGWTVHVITAATEGDSDGAAIEENSGMVVHRLPRRSTLDDLYNSMKSRRKSNRGTSTRASNPAEVSEAPPGPWTMLRRDLSYFLALPDLSRGWILRAAWRARSLTREHHFRALITSGPPHGAHVAGALAAGRTPLVLDFRDPWLHQLQIHRTKNLMPSRLQRWLEPRLARFAFRAATASLTNTANFARELQAEQPSLPVRLLSNGIDPERLPSDRPGPRGRVISHVGTLYAGRDLGPFLRALRLVMDRRGRGADCDGVCLKLAGAMDPGHRERFQHQLAAEGLEHSVDILGMIPGAEALDLVRSSRLSLVLAQNQKLQIPAKLYESIALGVPTLVIAERDSASYQEAVRLGAHACEADEIEAIAVAIEETTGGAWSGPVSPAEPIDYPSLAARLEALLEEFTAGDVSRAAGKRHVEATASAGRS